MRYAGENAIMKMIKVLKPVEDLNKIKGVFNEEEEETINRTMEGFDQQYGHEGRPGMSQLLKETTVNIGVITGGSKVNIVPGTCEVEVDVRVPIGISWEHMPPGSLARTSPVLAVVSFALAISVIAAPLGAIAGAFGFGITALVRRIRETSSPDTTRPPQTPPA